MIPKSSGTRQRVIKLNNISKSLSKAPSVLTAIACIVSFAMLVTLLLFQGGILYSMGLTMLTSDILVTAITIVLAVCAILSLAAMIRSMVANKKNKKLIHNIIADVEGSKEAEKTASPAPVQPQEEVKKESTPAVSDTSSDDDEPEEANGESIPEVVTTATHVTPDTKDSDKKIVGSVVSKGMDESTLETLDKLMEQEQNNEKDMTPPVVVAPDVQSAMQEKTEPVERSRTNMLNRHVLPSRKSLLKRSLLRNPLRNLFRQRKLLRKLLPMKRNSLRLNSPSLKTPW